MTRDTTMRCVFCGRPCDDRPVRYEAMCWTCWHDGIEKSRAPLPWWRRLLRRVIPVQEPSDV